MTPEGRVKAKVKKALKVLGHECWMFMPVQSGYGAPALDFLLSIRGRFVAIETKAPGKTLSPLQETTKAAIEKAGGIVLVVWDEDTLAIAMKIILALECAPNVPYYHVSACIDAARPDHTTGFKAHRLVPAEDKRKRPQHLRPVVSAEEIAAAASRYNGASGEEPE